MLRFVVVLLATVGTALGQGAVNTGGQYDPNAGPSDTVARPPKDYRPYSSSDDVGPGWHYSSYPNPQTDLLECGRGNRMSWICDPDSVITMREADELDALAADIRRDTSCPCNSQVCTRTARQAGFIVAVAMMNKIQRPYKSDGGSDLLTDFRNWVTNLEKHRWRFDRCDEDIIILFSKYDSMIYTVTGEKARETLTDELLYEITVDSQEYFAHSIFMGIKHMLYGIRKVLMGKLNEYRRERQHHAQIYSYQYYRGDRSSQNQQKGGAGRSAASRSNNSAGAVFSSQWLIGLSIAAAMWRLRKYF
ncbi:uncharacterized protein LOC135487761 [Lineus longissimus]|uniref:uncharacterized protein LOC135487761 n=1 Tax=Lineus longissimus TaxID=88925 RepID=UPI002B4E1476